MAALSQKNNIQRFAQQLFEPAHVDDPVRKRTGTLAASIAFVEVLLLVLGLISGGSTEILPLIVTVLFSYVAVRRGYIGVGSALLVLGLSVWYLIYIGDLRPTGEGVRTLIAWSVLPVIVASSLFSLRGVFLTGLLNFGVIMSIPFIFQGYGYTFGDVGPSTGLPVTAIGLILVVMRHRNSIERIRQKALQDSNNMLRESEANLEKRVQERTAELETANEQLRALDTLKSQFLASMSHELRTPLNAILNFTEFVSLGILGPTTPEQKDALGNALESGKHLLALINDVLDMTKIGAGMMKLMIEDVDLNKELVTVTEATRSLVKDKPIEFVTEIEPNLPRLQGDRRRIRQILLNLLSNAVKFTETGRVTLRARRVGGEVEFAVTDTGSGIAPEDQRIIFEPFRQTERGISHEGGTGLGLPISKNLAESHGGRMWLESQVGVGSTFFVALPMPVQNEQLSPAPELAHV